MWQLAIVELKVRKEAGFLVWAVGTDEGAFVCNGVDKAALPKPSSVRAPRVYTGCLIKDEYLLVPSSQPMSLSSDIRRSPEVVAVLSKRVALPETREQGQSGDSG